MLHHEGVLASQIWGQLIRCSTSVAPNYRAACLAKTKPTFVATLSIVLEKVDESYFWLEFATDEGLLGAERVDRLLKEVGELRAIFVTSRMTATRRKRTK